MRKLTLWILLIGLLAGGLFAAAALADGAANPLTVDGKTQNIVLDFNEAPSIRVTVPDGTTALRVEAERISTLDGMPVTDEEDRREWSEWYDRYRLRPLVQVNGQRFYDSGVWQVTASTITDDYDDGDDLGQDFEWTTLATVEVTVRNWLARLNAPSVTLSGATVARGGWVHVTLNAFQQKNEWYWYELSRMDEDSGEWGDWFNHQDVTLKSGVSQAFDVPTLNLESGTYRLWVRTEAVGYEDNGAYKTFIVTEGSPLQDGIGLSAASVPVSVPLQMNLRAAGADWLEVTMTMDEDPYWRMDPFELDGEMGTWWPDFDRPGTYRATLTAHEGNGERTAGTASFTVTAADYLAEPGFSGFPGVLSAGQALNGTLTLDSRTERYWMNLDYCPDDGDWESLYETNRESDISTAEAVSLPATLFARDGRYRLHVHAYAAGIESGYADYWFIRSSSAVGGSVTLKVNGGMGDVSLPASTSVDISISAPTATAARVLMGDHWEYLGSPEDFAVEWEYSAGDWAVVAQITTAEPVWREDGFDWGSFRWEDLAWGAYSNAVRIHASQENGRLDLPAITLDDDTVTLGEWLTGSVAGQDRGERYWGKVRRMLTNAYGDPYSEDLVDVPLNPENAFSVPIVSLDPGTYYLSVHVSAAGWREAERSVPFTVAEGASPLPELELYFPEDDILTSQDIAFYAYAEDADYLVVDVTWKDNPGWENHYDGLGGLQSWNWSTSDPGEFTFTLAAWRDGAPMGETSHTVTVSAPYGNLDAPVVQNIPTVMACDTAVNGAFDAVANAGDYHIQLNYCPEGEPWEEIYQDFRMAWDPALTSLDFPGDLFSRPGIYRLQIHAHARGYHGGHLDRQILVTEAGLEQCLGLTVNGGSDEDIYLHQNLPVTVTAPEGVTAVRLWSSSYDWWDYRANVGDALTWFWGFHNGGEETLVAQATTDASVLAWLEDPDHDGMRDFDWSQVSWTMISDEVTVSVIKYGDLEAPRVTFPEGTTVERGALLALEIEPVEHAYSYGVQIRRADDDEWHWLVDMDYPLTETTLIRVPTDGLDAGDYMVHIDPRCYGWHGDSVGYPVTVTQGASWTGEPVFRVFPTDILTREEVTVSIYAPGASEVALRRGDDEWFHEWRESLADHVLLSWARTYSLEAWAYYPDDDQWRQVGQTTDVRVSAPNGSVSMSVQVPTAIRTSDVLDIEAVCDFKGFGGSTECYVWNLEGEEIEPTLVDAYDEGGLHYVTYRVDANRLRIGPYFISAYAIPDEPGYEIAAYEGEIDVSGGTLAATLTVDPNPAEIFDDVHIHLSAPGATAVALCSATNDVDWSYEVGDSLDEDQTMWWDEEHFFYGLYTTDAVDPDEEGFSWENVHWEGMSNSVSLAVNPPSATLEEMNVTLDKTSVKRGERLKVSILNDNPGLEVSYGAHLERAGDGDQGFGYSWFGPEADDPKTIWVETLEAEPGDYRLVISANARSCRPVTTSIPVTITAADDGLKMTARDGEVVTGDMVQVVGYANGAVHLRLDVRFENETWDPQPDCFETDGNCLRAEVFTGEHPDDLVLDLTATFENGTTQTLQKRLTVTAPKGLLQPSIRLDGAWRPGLDLDFTVTVAQDAQYVAFVQEPGAEEAVFAEFVPRGNPVKSFRLSGNEYDFDASKTYEIRVIAAGTGYDGGQAYLPITRKTALSTLNLPSGLKTIEEEAFAGVAAERIVVPAGVTMIASGAFADCPNLTELVLPAGITAFAADALGNSGPVFVYGAAGGPQEAYAAAVDNLYFIPDE